jgi:hypothetical protein
MRDGEDWVMRPALRKMCLYENLINGVLDLADVHRMNAAIDVEDENEYRKNKANE